MMGLRWVRLLQVSGSQPLISRMRLRRFSCFSLCFPIVYIRELEFENALGDLTKLKVFHLGVERAGCQLSVSEVSTPSQNSKFDFHFFSCYMELQLEISNKLSYFNHSSQIVRSSMMAPSPALETNLSSMRVFPNPKVH